MNFINQNMGYSTTFYTVKFKKNGFPNRKAIGILIDKIISLQQVRLFQPDLQKHKICCQFFF